MTIQHRVLANSLPCGGPFLLASILDALGRERYTGREALPAAFNFKDTKNALQKRQIPPEDATIGVSPFVPWHVDAVTLHEWLSGVDQGQYMIGHLPWSSEVTLPFSDLDYRHLVILRDPRALLLALLFGEAVMPRFLRPDFASLSQLEQFWFMWNGGYLPHADVTLKSFAEIYRSMVAWKKDPTCLVVRFEDLVGIDGGGTAARQKKTVEHIMAYLNCPSDDVAKIVASIHDPTAYTYRIDQMEAWASKVDKMIIELVMKHCHPLYEEAGYRDTEHT